MISVRHLRKEFGDIAPLKDINLEIKKGEVVSIIGPSGTGKSTILRCLNLLEAPTSGEIKLNGELITEKNAPQIRKKMGMVFQSFNLFPHLTIIENVIKAPIELLGKTNQEAYDKGKELLKSVGLVEKAMSYPEELSGGQKQRVAIARTLAMEPEVILFDEPTSALDPTMVGEVVNVIRNLASQGMTMLIVTHEMKFARDISDKILYIDQGVVYEEGTPEEIFDFPKKERTRQFVKKLKVLEVLIDSQQYDFIGINTLISEFGVKMMLNPKTIYGLETLFEEVCVQTILPMHTDDFKVRLVIEFQEDTGNAKMNIYHNVVDLERTLKNNEISSAIVSNVVNNCSFSKISNGEYTCLFEAELK